MFFHGFFHGMFHAFSMVSDLVFYGCSICFQNSKAKGFFVGGPIGAKKKWSTKVSLELGEVTPSPSNTRLQPN